MTMDSNGQLVRNDKGQFVEGSGGRPKGSKNAITVHKLMLEEAFRSCQKDKLSEVLAMILQQALDGDKGSQKLVWDSTMSKMNIVDDKAAGGKQTINVKTLNVVKDVIEGDFTNIDEEETIQ